MKKIYILILIIVFGGATIIFWPRIKSNQSIACTMEAKICPDGSAVGRTGPNCQFAECPSPTPIPTVSKGYLIGQVTLGPTCPVERIPPDPQCAPKPYSTLLDISSVHNFFIEVHTDVQGMFRMQLLPGAYTIMIRATELYPRCESKEVVITAGATTTIEISCDTGIR